LWEKYFIVSEHLFPGVAVAEWDEWDWTEMLSDALASSSVNDAIIIYMCDKKLNIAIDSFKC